MMSEEEKFVLFLFPFFGVRELVNSSKNERMGGAGSSALV